jgi:hypothetical protein
MAMVLGSVEDEQCFSTLSFTKNKLNNQLTTHLDLIVCMYAQFFCTLLLQSKHEIKRKFEKKIVLFGNTNPNF